MAGSLTRSNRFTIYEANVIVLQVISFRFVLEKRQPTKTKRFPNVENGTKRSLRLVRSSNAGRILDPINNSKKKKNGEFVFISSNNISNSVILRMQSPWLENPNLNSTLQSFGVTLKSSGDRPGVTSVTAYFSSTISLLIGNRKYRTWFIMFHFKHIQHLL